MSQEQEQEGFSASEISKTGGTLAKLGTKVIKGIPAIISGGPAAWIGGGGCAIIFFFVLPLFLGILILLGIGGEEISFGGPTVHAGPPDSGTGVKDNFCQDFGVMDYDSDGVGDECSIELKNLINEAASWAKMPSAVLNGVALIEGLDFSLTDTEVDQQSAPGGVATPCAGTSDADGPMQFFLATWEGNSFQYGNAAIEAEERDEEYTTDRCNLLDALYAAAKLLKLSTGKTLDDDSPWTDEDVKAAGMGYYTGGLSCIWSDTPDFDYCEELLGSYNDKKDDVVGDSSSPQGRCPVEGVITSYFDSEHPLGIDIQSNVAISNKAVDPNATTGDTVLSPISGEVTYLDDSDSSGYGLYLIITNSEYEVLLSHFEVGSFLVIQGEQVSADQTLGTEDNTGNSSGPHVHYEIHDSAGVLLNPEPFLPVEQVGGNYYCKRGATGTLP